MTDELFAFFDGFDESHIFEKNISKILGTKISIRMCTNFRQIFGAIIKESQTTEIILFVDIAAICKIYQLGDVEKFDLICSIYNAADALTKANISVC